MAKEFGGRQLQLRQLVAQVRLDLRPLAGRDAVHDGIAHGAVAAQRGAEVEAGEVGEVCARGYQQFVHYLHDPEATAAALDADGFVVVRR